MKSPNILTEDSGFTLIEAMITIGIFLVLVHIGLFMSMDSIQKTSLLHDRDLLVSLLWQAREEALADVGESPHGIYITPDTFVLFSGIAYNPHDPTLIKIPHSTSLSFSGDSTIIFEPLSGNILSSETKTRISHDKDSTEITVNMLGRIDW